jgi:PAS domain S-box-containing protein
LLVETPVEGFWLCDTEGHIFEANDAHCRMISYSRESLLQMHINQLDAIEQPHITRERISHILAKGHMRFKTKHRTASGGLLPLLVSVSYRAELGDYLFALSNDVSKGDHLTAGMSGRNRLFLKRIDTPVLLLSGGVVDPLAIRSEAHAMHTFWLIFRCQPMQSC